jgi:hypothetical protein
LTFHASRDIVFTGYRSPSPVPWEIEYTDDFGAWWEALDEAAQHSVAAAVELLEDHGPRLGVPRTAPGSRHRVTGICES